MNLLTRNDIISLLKKDEDIINDEDGFFQKGIDEDYSQESHFQQCSVDLHIGGIYLPEVKNKDRGDIAHPITTEHVLNTGHTALVRTIEKVKLPNNIAGICFSPSRITLKGVLITNMGHVDPGYEGHLHFTAINMGKSSFVLRHKDIICTMLLIQLNSDTVPYGPEVHKEDIRNTGIEVPASVSRNLPKLSKDFLDVEKRSRTIAKNEVRKSQLWAIIIPILFVLLLTILTIFQNYFQKPWEKQIATINDQLKQIAYVKQYDEKLGDIKEIKEKIVELENKFKKRDSD